MGMLAPTSAVVGMGLSKEVALITDGRFSEELEDPVSDILPLRLLKEDPSFNPRGR